MDRALFVENIKKYCARNGIKPTVACRESGVGTSFINNIESRGQIPSVERVQQLAAYLGVTTSDLLGETPSQEPQKPGGRNAEEELILQAWRASDQRARDMVRLALEPWIQVRKKDQAI